MLRRAVAAERGGNKLRPIYGGGERLAHYRILQAEVHTLIKKHGVVCGRGPHDGVVRARDLRDILRRDIAESVDRPIVEILHQRIFVVEEINIEILDERMRLYRPVPRGQLIGRNEPIAVLII